MNFAPAELLHRRKFFSFSSIPERMRARTSSKNSSLSGRRSRRPRCLLASPFPPTELRQPPTRSTSSFAHRVQLVGQLLSVVSCARSSFGATLIAIGRLAEPYGYPALVATWVTICRTGCKEHLDSCFATEPCVLFTVQHHIHCTAVYAPSGFTTTASSQEELKSPFLSDGPPARRPVVAVTGPSTNLGGNRDCS